MAEIITIEGYNLSVESGDNIEVEKTYCHRCHDTHLELNVIRKGKKIAGVGDGYKLHGVDEIYGGVILDYDLKLIPEHKWVTHIISNEIGTAMTDDRMSYIGLCGSVLDHTYPTKNDRMVFASELQFYTRKTDKERLCPKCWKIYEAAKHKSKKQV